MRIQKEAKIKYLIYYYFFCYDTEVATKENLDKIKLLEINPTIPRRIVKPALLVENKGKQKKSFLTLYASEDNNDGINLQLNNFFFGYFFFIH